MKIVIWKNVPGKGLGPKLGSVKGKMLYWERDIWVGIREFGAKMGFKGKWA